VRRRPLVMKLLSDNRTGIVAAMIVMALTLCVRNDFSAQDLFRYQRADLPGFDAFVYVAMAEQPSIFTLPPWGYRILSPWLAHGAVWLDPISAYVALTWTALTLCGAFLYLFQRRLGFRALPALAGVLIFALAPPTRELLRAPVLVEPVGILLLCALLWALEAGAGPALLGLVVLLGTANKESFFFYCPALFFALVSRTGWKPAFVVTSLSVAPAAVLSMMLRFFWTPGLTDGSLPPPHLLRLMIVQVLGAWPDWIRTLLLQGILPLALLGSARASGRAYLKRYGFWLAIALAQPFAGGLGRLQTLAPGTASDARDAIAALFFVDDVGRLLIYALPLLLPLCLLAVDRVCASREQPQANPIGRNRLLETTALVLSVTLLLGSPLFLDRYRRTDLRGIRDGKRVLAVCRQSLALAWRLARGKTVDYDAAERSFTPGRSYPDELVRMRWFLKEGWGPAAEYGTGPIQISASHATLLLPCLRPADIVVFLSLAADNPTSVRVAVNGRTLGRIPQGREAEGHRLRVPGQALFRGDNLLSLETDDPAARLRLLRIRLQPLTGAERR
jgi:hypothetical protein